MLLVDLIQVVAVYFVRGDHDRTSVAQALGQLEIEARVVVWQVDGPLPWETRLGPPGLTGQETAVLRLFKKVRRESARLLERYLLSLCHLVIPIRMRPSVHSGPSPQLLSDLWQP